MNTRLHSAWFLSLALALAAPAWTHAAEDKSSPAPPTIPQNVAGKESVSQYLLVVADQCVRAAEDFKAHAQAYADLVKAHGNDYAAAAKAQPARFVELITAMQDDYRRLDSFGYEYIEGIVAGVPSLAKYDVELDAGVPAQGAAPDDDVAPVKITAGATVIDRQGSLNNFLIEPTVFGSKFSAGQVNVDDQVIKAPDAAVVVALADYAVDGYRRLQKDAVAWKPTTGDCFAALAAMTPTLADYFEEWKASKLSGAATGGRFVAVSRVSDMRGIMSSVRLIWLGVRDEAAAKDKPLADSVTRGYDQVLGFIDTVEAREKRAAGEGASASGGGMDAQEIDALGSQAKEMADRVTAQVHEAASVLGVDVD